MYLIRPPFLMRWAFPKALFRMPDTGRDVYLTFDDGPCQEATPFVLDILAEEQVHATFFLLGKNAEKEPQLMLRIRNEGHSIGNHGWDHLNGWKTPTTEYVANWERAVPLLGGQYFRPPYGRITPAQYRALHPQTTVVMWDVISGDFDTRITPDQCHANVMGNTRSGSIIVMHDSQKALPKLRCSLKVIIRSMKAEGFQFKKL
ncbi:MAG: polysaccharide deacetylase family protein [Flavobacteriales bacterium]|nr:polysaccharide deacetylase family protein [Flavobacteriales bacterium]